SKDGALDANELTARMQQMAGQRQRMMMARLDADGDGKVTREEVRMMLRNKYARYTTLHREARMQREFDRTMRNDFNRDGSITLDEIGRSVEMQSALRYNRYGTSSYILVPMDLDRDKDGVVTRDEFLAAVRIVFSEIDSDKDNVLSEAEMQRFMLEIRKVRQRQARERRKQYSARRVARQLLKCRFTDMPKGAKPVFASAYRGQGLANLTFKGRQQLVSVAHLNIEEGPDNLALILSAPGNVVWQITGAKDRVAKVYIGSRFSLGGKSTVAVSGIDKAKVHFVESSACMPYSFSSAIERTQIMYSLRAVIGVQPLAAVHVGGAGQMSLPSGKLDTKAGNPLAIAAPKGSPGSVFWTAVMRSFPNGIIRLNAKEVVSQMPMETGEVLPGRAGLAQLIDQGALELPKSTSIGAALLLPLSEVRIVAPITMPTGLGRSVVRKFVLARNVKVPTGLQSQVCVVSEADGKPVAGSGRCW
ncbi:MAG: hypothetical protein KDJ29_04650, partial [Hyphomicrobiales bacterium]|nr:hypothetical protein [Hyphomicrobiales bacterium]